MLAHKESIYYYSIVFMFKLCVCGGGYCYVTVHIVCVKLQLSFFRNYPHYLPYF